MTDTIELSTTFPVTPERLYRAWLDSAEHSAFTGAEAVIDPTVGGAYTAWDGYIEGLTLELEPSRRILQSWRTSEFPPDNEDALLEVLLEPLDGGTKLTLINTNLPPGDGPKYEDGWQESYFDPMREYFGE